MASRMSSPSEYRSTSPCWPTMDENLRLRLNVLHHSLGFLLFLFLFFIFFYLTRGNRHPLPPPLALDVNCASQKERKKD